MNNKLNVILNEYTAGSKTVEETNKALTEIGSGLYVDPEKNTITEEEKRQTVVGYYPEQTNGFGLLDTGTGTMDKVQIKNGHLVNCDCGASYALVYVAGRMYHVNGTELVA